MSDELRSRIMDVLRKHKLSHPKGGTAAGAWCECSCGTVETTLSRDHAELLAQRHQAQAIIDEFDLGVEERIDKPGMRGINPAWRLVGKWEEQ